jgi:RsiW-degrading membrane proteinase PrsW (M82 family)
MLDDIRRLLLDSRHHPAGPGTPSRTHSVDNHFMQDQVVSENHKGAGGFERAPMWLYAVMLLAAAGGGWTAVAIAMLPGFELENAAWFLLFAFAPLYEEALKPLGVYFVFIRWPHIALSQLHVALLCAAGGLTFALVESWLYVEKYPDAGSGFVLFRFTAPVAMHVVASFVMGLGLSGAVLSEVRSRARLAVRTRQAFFSAAAIHMAYNLTVLVLAIVGIRDLLEETGG